MAVATSTAAETDNAERKALLDHFNQSSAQFLASVEGLTDQQWNFKPSADAWSIAECAEHIVLSEDSLRDLVLKRVLTGPARTDRTAVPAVPDEKVLKMITDRTFKAKAPEPLNPTRRFSAPQDAVQAFKASRERTREVAKTREGLRDHTAPHPAVGELDGYQWLLYLSGHTMRHTAQIREVKASPGFPRDK
jgi:hypothetical protein